MAAEGKSTGDITKNINNNTTTTQQQQYQHNNSSTTVSGKCRLNCYWPKDLRHFLLSYIFEVSLPKLSILMDSCWETATLFQWTGRVTNTPFMACSHPVSGISPPSVRLAWCHPVSGISAPSVRHTVNLKTNNHRMKSDKDTYECGWRLCSQLAILQGLCCDC